MVMETTSRFYEGATNLYLGWIDASLNANERWARVAHVWIDELLGAQQDLVQSMRRAIEETQSTFTEDGEPAGPLTWISRAGDLAQSGYFLWSETGLKAQERLTRIVQTTFEELSNVGVDLSARAEEQISEMTRRANRR